jgi:hypothetical protein
MLNSVTSHAQPMEEQMPYLDALTMIKETAIMRMKLFYQTTSLYIQQDMTLSYIPEDPPINQFKTNQPVTKTNAMTNNGMPL